MQGIGFVEDIGHDGGDATAPGRLDMLTEQAKIPEEKGAASRLAKRTHNRLISGVKKMRAVIFEVDQAAIDVGRDSET